VKVLVTGGSGFIGSALVRHLLLNTSYRVVNLDKLTYSAKGEISKNLNFLDRYTFYHADICNQRDVNEIFLKEKPDFVMHLAAETHVDRSIESPLNFVNTNVLGTFNLLEIVRNYWDNLEIKRKDTFRFQHISTDEVFGDLNATDSRFNEESPYKPSSPYSATKASADHLVRAWHRTYGLPAMITNCSNNYGPYQHPEKLIPLTIMRLLSRLEVPVYGDGQQIRDWLYVDDHIEALMLVLEKGAVGATYCIGGDNELTNLEIIKMICNSLTELMANPISSNFQKKKAVDYYKQITFVDDRPGHDKRYAIDSNLMKNELNWLPKEHISTGIEKTVRWYIENVDWLSKNKLCLNTKVHGSE
jgi:dTDP-glucose 4,6-dehydratase